MDHFLIYNSKFHAPKFGFLSNLIIPWLPMIHSRLSTLQEVWDLTDLAIMLFKTLLSWGGFDTNYSFGQLSTWDFDYLVSLQFSFWISFIALFSIFVKIFALTYT